MLENYPLIQVIISLIILLLMGYIGYNIYLIELQNMFQGENDIRKETTIISGVYDFSNGEVKYNTGDKTETNFKNIKPSINQEGGAEYSYNFWLSIDQEKMGKMNNSADKDILLFLKGEKNIYYNSKTNYNCGNIKIPSNPVIITKNPLVRLSGDGTKIAIEYNNIYNTDSYQHGSEYKNCNLLSSTASDWNKRNKNMLGIWDIEFSNKWFMVTIVMKEVADSNNVLAYNRASCKMYVNGVKLLDKKVETKYVNNVYSATFKNNSSPLYVNPVFTTDIVKDSKNPYNKVTEGNVLKMADVKYYNYAINDDIITALYTKGVNTEVAVTTSISNKLSKYNMVSVEDMEYNKIKEL